MALRRFNGIPHPHIFAALIPVEDDLGLPGFDLLMPQKEFTVGRGEHNDICIRGAGISYVVATPSWSYISPTGDERCKLVWDREKRTMFVRWLPTTNGTRVRADRYILSGIKTQL